MESVYFMVCCRVPICRSCHEKLLQVDLPQCKNCSTILEVDKVRQNFQIESEMNDLEHTSKCLWFTKVFLESNVLLLIIMQCTGHDYNAIARWVWRH